MDFYSAEEAREYTEKSKKRIQEDNIEKIKDAITGATIDGKYDTSVYFDFPLDQRILDEIKGLGYKVTTDNFFVDKFGYVLSWEE